MMDGGVVCGREEKFSLFVDILLPQQHDVVTATMTLSNFNRPARGSRVDNEDFAATSSKLMPGNFLLK